MTTPRSISVPTLVGAGLTATSGAMPLMLAGALVVLVSDDLAISEALFGVSVAAYFGTSALLSMWSGRLTDHIGWRRAMLVGNGLSVASVLGVAMLGRTYPAFLAFMAIGGAAQSLSMPASNLALVREMPIDRQGLVFGIKQTSNPVAGLVAGLLIPGVAVGLGWRWAFAAAGVIPVVALAVVARMPAAALAPPRRRPGNEGELDLPPLVVVGIGGFLASFGVIALSSFVVASAVDTGVEVGRAGVYVAVASVVGLTGRVVGGWAVDRMGSRGLRPAAALLVVGVLGPLGLAIGRVDLVLPAMVLAYASAWGWPGLFQYGITAYHRHAPASATGIAMVGILVGGAVGPITVGALIPHIGYRGVWVLVSAFLASSAACLLWAAHLLEGRLAARTAILAEGRV